MPTIVALLLAVLRSPREYDETKIGLDPPVGRQAPIGTPQPIAPPNGTGGFIARENNFCLKRIHIKCAALLDNELALFAYSSDNIFFRRMYSISNIIRVVLRNVQANSK